jgi:hypothetical protein
LPVTPLLPEHKSDICFISPNILYFADLIIQNSQSMESISIKPTADTPRVNFDTETNVLLLEGRSLPENPHIFFDPLFIWAGDYSLENIVVSFRLEYFNTASSKQIFNFLKILRENKNIHDLTIRWHYEEGDYDSLETGQQFQSILKINFEFIECAESEF